MGANFLLVSYVGVTDVVKHLNTDTQIGFGNNSTIAFFVWDLLHYD